MTSTSNKRQCDEVPTTTTQNKRKKTKKLVTKQYTVKNFPGLPGAVCTSFDSITGGVLTTKELQAAFDEITKTNYNMLTQPEIKVFNKICNIPRKQLTIYNDDTTKNQPIIYGYSRTAAETAAWSLFPYTLNIIRKLKIHCGQDYNLALLNLYEDGNHSIGAHSDNEKSLVGDICSLSIGTTRDFVFSKTNKNKENTDIDKWVLPLYNGACVIMGENCQRLYKHAVPARRSTKNHIGPRINITLREVKI